MSKQCDALVRQKLKFREIWRLGGLVFSFLFGLGFRGDDGRGE